MLAAAESYLGLINRKRFAWTFGPTWRRFEHPGAEATALSIREATGGDNRCSGPPKYWVRAGSLPFSAIVAILAKSSTVRRRESAHRRGAHARVLIRMPHHHEAAAFVDGRSKLVIAMPAGIWRTICLSARRLVDRANKQQSCHSR